MKNIYRAYFIAITVIAGVMIACQPAVKPLKEGIWRGVFVLPSNEIPFKFEVKKVAKENTSLFLINGKERFELKKNQL